MAFRFFINVDQCLNMNNFDFFFYQKRYRNEFHLTEDVYIGEGTGLSFHKAAADIRMYLDKFPYRVNDYQIIIAMRSDYNHNVTVWRDTLLSRLLDIDFDLRQSNIIIRSGSTVQVAVNLIMLYEANVVKSLHTFDIDYMTAERLGKDCKLLLREIGVPEEKENDLASLKTAWEAYVQNHEEEFNSCRKMPDGITPAHPIYVFFKDLLKQYEVDREKNQGKQVSIFHALKEVLDGYQIFELVTDKQNRNKDINALLRVVEFATTDFEVLQGIGNTISLSELCRSHWKKILALDDSEIQKRYARMLYQYRERLQKYVADEDDGRGTTEVESTLPECILPSDDDIGIGDSIFETDNSFKKAKNDPKKQIQQFRHSLSPIGTMMSRWESTYKRLKKGLSEIDEGLKAYASDLGNVYNEELKKRKDVENTWKNTAFLEDSRTKQEIEQLKSEEKELLDKMNQPQMTPSLQFQDQLNMETSLEQENLNITHYIRCIQSVSVRNFLLLILLIVGMVAIHYFSLQPYNFNAIETALYFLKYIGISAGCMFFTWMLPIQYYERKIRQCLIELEKEMDKYITGYFDRAKQFHEYINLLNRLDYVERHMKLKKGAVKTTEWIISARSWHINQAKVHLEKLKFFDGLTSTYESKNKENEVSNGDILNAVPDITRNHVDDVMDNKLYWPQQS